MFVHLVWTKLVFIPRPPAILNQLCGRGPRQRRRPLQQLLGKRDGVGFHQGAVLPVRRVHHLEANWVLNRWSGCCKSASQISDADCTPNPGDVTQQSSATDKESCAMSSMMVHG